MGAYSQVIAFDLNEHRQRVVPALCELLDSGQMSGVLETLFVCSYRRARASEGIHAEFYRKHPKVSDQMLALQAGLGLKLGQSCPCLDSDLGVRHTSLAELLAVRPDRLGGCDAQAGQGRELCAFNRHGSQPLSAEWLMALFQQLVKTACRDEPPAEGLGRRLDLTGLSWWYGNEAGLDYDAAERFFEAAKDPVVLLLARLSKRGGIWGWADGGYGEGLLGWLDAEECLQLSEGLAAYDLSATAALPELEDDFLRQQLPERRAEMACLRDFALSCSQQGLGILLERL